MNRWVLTGVGVLAVGLVAVVALLAYGWFELRSDVSELMVVEEAVEEPAVVEDVAPDDLVVVKMEGRASPDDYGGSYLRVWYSASGGQVGFVEIELEALTTPNPTEAEKEAYWDRAREFLDCIRLVVEGYQLPECLRD